MAITSEMGKMFGFAAPSVVLCPDDPQRRALFFKNVADAQQYYIALARNGTDAIICARKDGGGAYVCEVSPVSADEVIAWVRERG